MRRFRFHLGTLLLLVLLVGVGVAALRESNETWDSGIFSITLGMLSISILLAIYRTEKRRAFWLGFALFGSAYLGYALVPSLEPRLITTKALAFLDSRVPRSSPAEEEKVVTFADAGSNMWDGPWLAGSIRSSQPSVVNLNKGNGTFEEEKVVTFADAGSNMWDGPLLPGATGTAEDFVRIGHSLLALIAAFVGGQLSRYLCGNNR
jgi:hypothetical protein